MAWKPPACPTGVADRVKQGCCSAADAADARRVADLLEIPFYALNFEAEFGRIVDYFVAEYTAGRTPNPCIVCNTWLKFGKLAEYAEGLGAQFVSTGHYARMVAQPESDLPALCAGHDAAKDQSYVLFGVDRHLLPRLKLPVGEFRKEEIRRMGGRTGASRVADKPTARRSASSPTRTTPDWSASAAANWTPRARSSRPTAPW